MADSTYTQILDLQTEGTQEAVKDLNAVGDAAAQMGKDFEKAERNAEEFADKSSRKVAAFQGGIDVAAGSVATFTGGLALLGVETDYIENIEKATFGAFAFAAGLKQTGDGVVALMENTGLLTKAQKLFNTVLKANPIFLIVSVIAAVTAGVIALTAALSDNRTSQEKLNDAIAEGRKEIQDSVKAIEDRRDAEKRLGLATAQTTKQFEDRITALKEEVDLKTLYQQLTEQEGFAERFAIQKQIDAILERQRVRVFGEEKRQELLKEKEKAEAEAAEKERNRHEDAVKREQERIDNLRRMSEGTEFIKRLSVETVQTNQEEIESLQALAGGYQELTVQTDDTAESRINALKGLGIELLENREAIGDAISGVGALFGEESKQAFEIQKGVSIAQTTISTIEGAIAAYKSLAGIPVVGPGLGAAAAAGVTASGLAAVRQIQSQTFNGSGSGGGGSLNLPSGSSASQGFLVPSTPTAEDVPQPEPVQAYVIGQQITNQQALDSELRLRSTL